MPRARSRQGQGCHRSAQERLRPFFLDTFRIHPLHFDVGIIGDATVGQGFTQTLIRVFELNVFADDADGHGHAGIFDLGDNALPLAEVRALARGQMEIFDDDLVQAFVMQNQRQFVDRIDIFGGDHRLFFDVGKQRDLRLDVAGQQAVGPAQQDMGLDADLPQRLDAMLGRLWSSAHRRSSYRALA